ncbi:hypothetical protein N9L68_03010 [bacterium]|nr:hypothetical protein [bacterium]
MVAGGDDDTVHVGDVDVRWRHSVFGMTTYVLSAMMMWMMSMAVMIMRMCELVPPIPFVYAYIFRDEDEGVVGVDADDDDSDGATPIWCGDRFLGHGEECVEVGNLNGCGDSADVGIPRRCGNMIMVEDGVGVVGDDAFRGDVDETLDVVVSFWCDNMILVAGDDGVWWWRCGWR